jgi:hypothetical protein
MGKNWADGLTAATDARVARAAAAHRGLRYRRPANDVRVKRGSRRFVPPSTDADWTAALAYAVGLVATDGCLSKNRKTVTQVSKDFDLLTTFLQCIGSEARIAWNRRAYRAQVSDVGFYRWLESIGLTSRKSLTLGALSVPTTLFAHVARGLLDGDGSVKFSVVVPNPRRYPHHTYPRLQVEFVSASEDHLRWLRGRLHEIYGFDGWMTVRKKKRANPLYLLRYSKHEAIPLLTELYRDPSAPRLERKWRVWDTYRSSARPTRIWTSRRSDGTVDIRVSNTRGRKPVRVRVPPPAPA